jgi:PfaD family protein
MNTPRLKSAAPVLRRYGAQIADVAQRFRAVAEIVELPGEHARAVCLEGDPGFGHARPLAILPPLYPEWLGDRAFVDTHGLRFPYVVGEMARGIATAEMVIAAGRAGMLGFFGAAGLAPSDVERAIDRISAALGPLNKPWGANLIHSPDDLALEDKLVDLYLARGVTRVSASAFMALVPSIVRYAATGLTRDGSGAIVRRNHVFAKVSRAEVAEPFLQPAPAAMLDALVAAKRLTRAEADLAALVPVAGDITAEADSGGHTDNRPLSVLLPQLVELRSRKSSPSRIGAAGGLGAPGAVAAAFSMGAAYVLTGSVNQAAVESGLSPIGRKLLAGAGSTDVAMAPSADMFEMGVKVQVLRKGLFFPMRAQRLYDLYRAYDSLEAIPAAIRAQIEKEIFRQSLEEIWRKTTAYFTARDPAHLARAERDPRLRMALVFRWYLGNSSRWPLEGAADRAQDFQIWCGPAMGAFNAWTAGSFLADANERTVVQIGLNLLEGAAVVTRAQQMRAAGVDVPDICFSPLPTRLTLE